jgi:Neuraminidase (sialidase)
MKIYIIIFALIFSSITSAQYKNIKVNKQNNRPNETSIAINPLNPLHLVAGANINNYYYSFDGGNTWNNGTLMSQEYGVWGDPCTIFDYDGNAYFFHLAAVSFDQFIDRIVCQKSTDGGITWEESGTFTGLNPPKQQDKEWACADHTRKNYIYVTWTQFDKYNSKNPNDSSNIMFSYSSDAGSSWSTALRINQTAGDCRDTGSTVEGAVPCVGPNGEIFVSWSGPLGIVFDRSTDGGISWLNEDIRVCPQVGGWAYDIEDLWRCNGLPVTACDISSGPYRGNIYINFSDRSNGNDDVDIFLVKSTDGGGTWGKPKRVNTDPEGNKKQQFMSWMSVDPVTGNIYILFYDRRNYTDSRTDVFIARSTDGGESFRNINISESSFLPKADVFFGDYVGVDARNDFVACMWTRLDNGILSIQYCGIDFKE